MVKKICYFICFCLFFMIFNLNVRALDNGIYVIHSAIDDNYVLDINGGSIKNLDNISLYYKNGGINQKFQVINLNDGYYEIRSLTKDSLVFDINGANFKNFSNISIYNKNGGNNQKWIIKESGDYYRIISVDENYALDANGAIAKNLTNIQLYTSNDSLAQKFRFEKISSIGKTIDDGIYTISSKLDENLVLDIHGAVYKNQSNLEIYGKNNGDNQKFIVTYLNNGYYKITAYGNINYSLDVHGALTKPETNVELYDNNNNANQQWIIKDTGDGYFNIISKCNLLALDVYGGKAKSGANIQTYTPHSLDGQKFKFNSVALIPTKTIDNGYFFIKSIKDSKKVLDINNGIMEDKRNVEIYNLNYGINQKWYIELTNENYYKILSNKDKDYTLQVDGDNNINIGKYNGSDNQLWIIVKADNSYYIVSKSGKYININNGNLENTTNINGTDFSGLDSQKFNFIYTADGVGEKVLENGIYRISSALDSNMFIDITGASKKDGTNVELWNSNGGNNQKFQLTYLSKGYYKITTLVDLEKSIDVENASTKNGSNVLIYKDQDSINQQWIIKDAGDGYFNIISNCNNLYMNVENDKAYNGANINMLGKNDSNSQKFKFIKSKNETIVIDVSSHQGNIDWNKVSNSGVYGVILRIGYWETLDNKFSEYINEVKRLGLPYGIYIFSYASTVNGANIEANFTNKIIDQYSLNPTLGIYYDLEDWYIASNNNASMLSKTDYDNIINTYINSVSKHVNNKYDVGLYASTFYIRDRFSENVKKYVKWVADYRGFCGYEGPHFLWQYTSSGVIDGINGVVDLSYLN